MLLFLDSDAVEEMARYWDGSDDGTKIFREITFCILLVDAWCAKLVTKEGIIAHRK